LAVIHATSSHHFIHAPETGDDDEWLLPLNEPVMLHFYRCLDQLIPISLTKLSYLPHDDHIITAIRALKSSDVANQMHSSSLPPFFLIHNDVKV